MAKYNYSKLSLKRISECAEPLQLIAQELIKEMDVTVLCGHRSKEEQDRCFKLGTSKLQWPRSKHNKTPSQAIDIVPFPIQWKDLGPYREMRERIAKIAKRLGVKIRIIDWDWPHTELS
jgi:peptidoglycan L-alanyl-D-glutamate endopeptidase CwlK